MQCPEAWTILSDKLWHLSLHQSKAFWFALAEARSTRPVALRQSLALVGTMPLDLEHLCSQLLTPAAVVAILEDLVRERQLRRSQATHIAETILHQVDARGHWRGEAGPSQVARSVLAPDVLRFADVGTH